MSANESPFQITPIDGGIQLSFEVRAVKAERQTKKAHFDHFEIVCDESAMIGGDDTAPPPLAYFAASVAF